MYELFYQFGTYSYVRSHLGNDSCLPIYKTNPAICDTPHQTHCVGNSIFPYFVMVMTVLWAELWFVVECRALCKKKPSRRNTTTINLDITTYDEQEFLSFPIHMAACYTVGVIYFLFIHQYRVLLSGCLSLSILVPH
jgi:hypothetical protein